MATEAIPPVPTDLSGRGEVWINEQCLAAVQYQLQQSHPSPGDPPAGEWRPLEGPDIWGSVTVEESVGATVFSDLRGYPAVCLRLEDGRQHLFSVVSLVGQVIEVQGLGDWLPRGRLST
jgi:hypothetical protein